MSRCHLIEVNGVASIFASFNDPSTSCPALGMRDMDTEQGSEPKNILRIAKWSLQPSFPEKEKPYRTPRPKRGKESKIATMTSSVIRISGK